MILTEKYLAYEHKQNMFDSLCNDYSVRSDRKNKLDKLRRKIMNVEVYSRKAIEEVLQNDKLIREGIFDNVAIISFYDPPNIRTGKVSEPVNYKGKVDRVFPIAIHDIDIEILEDYGLTFDTYFPEVDDLADFIINAIRECRTIICQCEYGQSRSAACAAAIKEYIDRTGINIFSDYRYYPNQLVYNKIYTALKSKNV